MLTAIVGILIGNLLIGVLFAPALQELRKILQQFSTIELPFEYIWPGAAEMTAQQRHEAEELAARKFGRLFREYTISFSAFRKIGFLFVGAIIVLAGAVVWQTALGIALRIFLSVPSVGLIVAVGFYLQRAIAPTPSQLVSIDFLQNSFANLHLSSMFDSAKVRVNLGREIDDPVAHIKISQDLLFFGYRFLIAVADNGCSRVYFVAYGQLDGKTKYHQIWDPQIQTFSIPLGDFSLSDAIRAMQPGKELHLFWWLFVPTPKGWVPEAKLYPRLLRDNITSNLGGRPAITVSLLSSCTWNSVDRNVEFAQKAALGFKSWKITRLDVPSANSPQAILRTYKDKIENVRGIKIADYPDGMTIGRAP